MATEQSQKQPTESELQKDDGKTQTEEATENENKTEEGDGKKKKGRAKSTVWEHFERVKDFNPDRPRAACNYCGNEYACDTKRNGTSTMMGHLKQCEKNPNRVVDKKQKLLAFLKKGGDEEVSSNTCQVVAWTKEGFRQCLAKYIILDELSFRHVEGEGFKQYSMYMNPKFNGPSRVTVARDCYRLFLAEKEKLKKVLRNQRVSITTDTWTSIQNINYMAVTAHWIGEDWVLQKRIINFIQVASHKGDTIANDLIDCLTEWGITKLFTITVDNASSNDVAINRIRTRLGLKPKCLVLGGKYLHMRCVCHIVNLVVADGLKELKTSIGGVRNAVRYVRSSPARLKAFKECAKEEHIESQALLCLDVPTRWNSTYLMLDAATKYEKAFYRMERDANYKNYFVDDDKAEPLDGPPLTCDWENAKIFLKFLKTFYHLTLRFSGSLYATSNLFFSEICEVKQELNMLSEEQDTIMGIMAASMNKKFDKYWGNPEKMNHVLFLGTILDPRYKIDFVEHCLGYMYPQMVAANISKEIQQTLYKLFEEYDTFDVPTPKPPKPQQLSSSTEDGGSSFDIRGSSKIVSHYLRQKQEMIGGQSKKNEVDKYLKEDCEDLENDNFDILDWWKVNSHKYRVLSRIARDVFASPVSTVASESAFSTGGRILDPFRSSLAPKMVEALICSKNWLSTKHELVIKLEYADEVESYKDSCEAISDEASCTTTVMND